MVELRSIAPLGSASPAGGDHARVDYTAAVSLPTSPPLTPIRRCRRLRLLLDGLLQAGESPFPRPRGAVVGRFRSLFLLDHGPDFLDPLMPVPRHHGRYQHHARPLDPAAGLDSPGRAGTLGPLL